MNHRTRGNDDGRATTPAGAAAVARGSAGRRRGGAAARTAALGLALVLAACGVEVNDELAGPGPGPEPTTPRGSTTTEPTEPDPTTTTTEARRPTTTEAPATTTTTRPAPAFGDGTHAVGTDVKPGRYVTDGAEGCYWKRLSALSDDFEAIITMENASHRGVVDIIAGDVGFDSSGCGRWSRWEAPAEAAESFGDGDWVVGHEIKHGVYQTTESADGESCYWELASGFTHDFGELLENDIPEGRGLIELRTTGQRFTSDDCGTWEKLR